MKSSIFFLLVTFFTPFCTSATFKKNLTVNDLKEFGLDFKVPRLIIVDKSAPCIIYDGVGSTIETKIDSNIDLSQTQCLSPKKQELEYIAKLKAQINQENKKNIKYEIYYISLDSITMPCPPCKVTDHKLDNTEFGDEVTVFQLTITR